MNGGRSGGRHRRRLRDSLFRYLFVLPLLMALVVGIVLYKLFDLQHIAADPIWVGYSTLVATYLLSRFVLAMQYTPPTVSDPRPEYLPAVTVVIPAMNEADVIERTIRAAAASDYPTDLLEIIAIDDGSTDDTGEIMMAMDREFENVRAIVFPENLGKREGMATGIMEGHGDLIVFIDSDSRVAPNAIRRIAQYFAYPEVGAVSGIADVDNKTREPAHQDAGGPLLRGVRCHQVGRSALRCRDVLQRSVLGLPTRGSRAGASRMARAVVPRHEEHLRRRPLAHQPCDQVLVDRALRPRRQGQDDGARDDASVPSPATAVEEELDPRVAGGVPLHVEGPSDQHDLVLCVDHPHAHGAARDPASALHPQPVVLDVPVLLRDRRHRDVDGLRALLPDVPARPLWKYGIVFAFFYTGVLVWQLPFAIANLSDTRWGTRAC